MVTTRARERENEIYDPGKGNYLLLYEITGGDGKAIHEGRERGREQKPAVFFDLGMPSLELSCAIPQHAVSCSAMELSRGSTSRDRSRISSVSSVRSA